MAARMRRQERRFPGPYNRQTFTLLRERKSLRDRSSKPFAGNTLRSLKRTSRRGRYLSLTLPNLRVPRVARLEGASGNRIGFWIGPRNGSTALAQYTV